MAKSKISTTSTTTLQMPKKTNPTTHNNDDVPLSKTPLPGISNTLRTITNPHAFQPKRVTKFQKARLIERAKRESELRKTLFKKSIELEKSDIKRRLDNRLNKVVRKFWDVKNHDILNLERELKGLDYITSLASVLRQLEGVRGDVAAATAGLGTDGGSSSDKENRRERVKGKL
ncbi:unnamed protein product [Ambrosiozyma monospora]|uniref:Unnamed protein product n=1 Tax=Ambrosiozyma monospora TaxID=43982 RepID=A0ACB5TV57_AMBMO|nr:unnamed protein product [Ambrosiozyma monospora]